MLTLEKVGNNRVSYMSTRTDVYNKSFHDTIRPHFFVGFKTSFSLVLVVFSKMWGCVTVWDPKHPTSLNVVAGWHPVVGAQKLPWERTDLSPWSLMPHLGNTGCPVSNHCGAPLGSAFQLCHLRTLSKKCSCLIRPRKKRKDAHIFLSFRNTLEFLIFLHIRVCVYTYVCLVRDMPRPLDDRQTLVVLSPLARTRSAVSTPGSRSWETAGGERGILSAFAISSSA